MAQKQDTLLNLQAFLVAQTINAVDAGDGYNKAAVEHGEVIAHELGIDMADHFKPTAEDYFNRLKLAAIHQCLVEAIGEEAAKPVLNMKKKDAAQYAAEKVKGTGWMPQIMSFATAQDDHDTVTEAAA